MTSDEIKRARELITAATPGPWKHDWGNADIEVPYPNRSESLLTRGDHPNYVANLEFTAAARTGWPAALDEVERLQESTRLLSKAVAENSPVEFNGDELVKLRSKIARYRQTLEWYADVLEWQFGEDAGARARAALEGEE